MDALRAETAFRQQRLADDFRRANKHSTRRFHVRKPRTDQQL
jgi:hypothetical protein